METLAFQPQREKLRSFDPLASVDMFRYDLQCFGHILPETRYRVIDEELSYITEAIDRSSRTSFILKRDENNSLIYFHQGEWTPYNAMLHTGLQVAKDEAQQDYRRAFLVDWAERDQQIGYQMRALKPGQAMRWINGYPHDVAARYGDDFMQQVGLQPKRKMGFLYEAVCEENGNITLRSQTIDQSDLEALSAIEQAQALDPELDLDGMLRVYDGTLRKNQGGYFHAGRREADAQQNIWETVGAQKDLIDYFINQLEVVAASDGSRSELELRAKKLTYGIWAALSERLTASQHVPDSINAFSGSHVAAEVRAAFTRFVSTGKVMSGCGGIIALLRGEDAVMDAKPEDVFDSLFGEKTESYSFNKRMFCVVCQAPPEENAPKKMCGPCGICKTCDSSIKAKNSGAGLVSLLT